MIRYFDSGLYTDTFYTKHRIDFSSDDEAHEWVEYDSALLADYYKEDLGLEYEDEDDKWEQVDQIFWGNLSYWMMYFEPLVFDERIALECGLTPFIYNRTQLLALSGCGMDLSPRLDAYQLLSHGTIDQNSRFFSSSNRASEYFEYVVGKDITKRVSEIISFK